MPFIPASPNLGTGPTNQQGPFPQPGSTTPTNQIIGPLPASTMPGQLAQTIPVMANFNFLLNALNGLQNQVNNITITPSPIHIDTTLPITGGPITATGTIGHATSGVVPGTYGDSANVAQVTVDKFGHVDFVADVPISSSGNFIQADYVLYPVGNASITNYRLLTPGVGITLTDGGAQGPVTISSTAASFFIQGFTFAFGEPQGNQWIEFTPNTTTIFAPNGGAPGGGGVSQSVYGQHQRLVVSTATGTISNGAGQTVSGTVGNPILWRNATPFEGGFTLIMAQGIEDTFVSDSRYCVGMGQYNTNNFPSNAHQTEPSAYLTSVGTGGAVAILKDSGDAHLNLFTNDGAGHSTKTDLGILPVASTDWFVITFNATQGSSSISWQLNNIATGSVLSGSTSSNLPTGFMRPIRYVDQGPTSTAKLSIALGPYFWQNAY